jgi:hypothetical protein
VVSRGAQEDWRPGRSSSLHRMALSGEARWPGESRSEARNSLHATFPRRRREASGAPAAFQALSTGEPGGRPSSTRRVACFRNGGDSDRLRSSPRASSGTHGRGGNLSGSDEFAPHRSASAGRQRRAASPEFGIRPPPALPAVPFARNARSPVARPGRPAYGPVRAIRREAGFTLRSLRALRDPNAPLHGPLGSVPAPSAEALRMGRSRAKRSTAGASTRPEILRSHALAGRRTSSTRIIRRETSLTQRSLRALFDTEHAPPRTAGERSWPKAADCEGPLTEPA